MSKDIIKIKVVDKDGEHYWEFPNVLQMFDYTNNPEYLGYINRLADKMEIETYEEAEIVEDDE